MAVHSYTRRLKTIYIMIMLPALLIIVLFIFFPVIFNVFSSFTNFSLRRAGASFIGLDNYISFFTNENTPTIMKNTGIYVFGVVIAQFCIGFFFAMLLSFISKARSAFSTILFVPWVVSQVLAVTAWRILFNDSYGLINYFLKNWGLNTVSFFSDNQLVLFTVMALNMWAGFPFSMTMLLSALKAVPVDVYEASRIDGANFIQQTILITIPMIKYQVATTLILITIYTFNIYAYVFALTNGGPLNYTEIIGLSMYKAAFVSGRLGYGSALAVVMLLINLVFALIYMYTFKHKDSEAL